MELELLRCLCKNCGHTFRLKNSLIWYAGCSQCCPKCKEDWIRIVSYQKNNDDEKQEKENDMKKVYEYVIHDETEILADHTLLADNESQARVLIGSQNASTVDFTKPDVKVVVRPFC